MSKAPTSVKDYCLVFYHIEKTAGTTFNEILMREYKAEHIFHLYGSRRRNDIESFKNLSNEERMEINCVTGHMSHLLAPYIPKPVKLITFLRNPLTQVTSSYYYQRNVRRTKGHQNMRNIKNLDEYLDWQIENRRDNAQTRYLADAVKFMENETGPIDMQKNGGEYLKRAFKRLNEIELVFITEEFDKAILTMQMELGWHRTPYYSRLNKSSNRPQLSNKTLERLKFVHRFDLELYEHAKKRHDKIVNRQKDLQKRLENFEKRNPINALIINTANSARNLPGGKAFINLLSSMRDAWLHR